MAVELAALADDCTPPPQPEPALDAEVMSGVLAFLKIEVVDLFTGLALASAMMLPTPGTNQRQSPDPDEIERLGERFSRNALILQLAAAHPIIPEVVRDPLRRVCRTLLDWYPDYSALAVAAARLIRSAG